MATGMIRSIRSDRSPTALAAIPRFDIYMRQLSPDVDADLKAAGAREVRRIRFAYDPESHFYEKAGGAEAARWNADVAFVGGGDPDRAELLDPIRSWSVAEQKTMAVYGSRWDRFSRYADVHRGMADGADYRYALAAASVLLGPVRRANRDGHSMRSFETPACGAFMLAERTADHSELFEDEKHVAFFCRP